jgi:aminopeptidase N
MRMIIRLLLWLAAVAAALADTYQHQPGVDVINYVFQITLTDVSDELIGTTTAEVRFLSSGIKSLEFDLTQNSGNGSGMTVTGVSSNGASLHFEHGQNRLRIDLPSPSVAGRITKCSIDYHGIPAAGLLISPDRYSQRSFFSNDWPDLARNWLPTIDHPSDKATDEMVVTAPAHYQVVSNGRKIEETDLPGGMRRTVWKESSPIPSWQYALGVARFAVEHVGEFRGVPVETWVMPQEREPGFEGFRDVTPGILEFFSDRIGPYPFEKLANVEANGVRGGMELASSIFYGYDRKAIGTIPWRQLVAHETAHQWFGDAVTERDWDDVWLSEGFATYFALLYLEHADGRDAFMDGLRKSRDQILAYQEKHPGATVVHPNLSDMSQILSPLIYQKGGWTLHMLRGVLNEGPFWAGIREYYRRYRYGNASTDDFRRVMEETSGKDLGWFFPQWLNRSGMPQLSGTWHYDAQARSLVVALDQTQAGAAFQMPVQVGIRTGGAEGLHIEEAFMNQKRQRFQIPLEHEPANVVLDPNLWLLMQSKLERDDKQP